MSDRESAGAPHLAGRAVIVTGSSQGIGRAVALGMAAEGASVVVNGRAGEGGSSVPLDALVDEIGAAGGRAVACAGSVADEATSRQLVEACRDAFGRIDALVCCAGVGEPEQASILDIEPEGWRELIDIHLSGTFLACRHAAPHLVEGGGGAIVTTSSHASLGLYGGTAYGAAKGGVESLTLSIAAELREHAVRANVVCPGARTRLSSGPSFERRIDDLHSRGILPDAIRQAALNPPDASFVAPLYAFLASDRAAGVSGRIFSAVGPYVGIFEQRRESLLAYRDLSKQPPWDVESLSEALLAAPALNQG